ncbi:MAG: hypothetical protein KAW39_01005 [Thermoplasmata archaeon]|nr:hypothetical protein [Thermoplasmata archaeon]
MKDKKPRYGEKTIELTVRFWTNDISRKENHIVPRVCWEHGMITLKKNESHGLAVKRKPFKSIAHLSRAVEELLKASNVEVLHGRYTKPLYSDKLK